METNRNYADECGDHGGTNRDGDPCGRAAGWGRDADSGKCRIHAGTSPDGSSHAGNDFAKGNAGGSPPEGNTNSVSHGLYAQTNHFYTDVIGEDIRALVDDIFTDYLEEYRERHGDPTTGTEAELFRIAVSFGKHVYADNWAETRPDSLESGHAMVDRETKTTEDGDTYYKYKETVVAAGQARLSRDRRSWLKDLGLMGESPDAKQANALADGIDLTLSTEEKQGLNDAFDVQPDT
jgi:hypothetical protein